MKGIQSTFLNASFAAPAAVYTLFALVTLCIFNIVYEVQPVPFLDEIFHIPQAEKYCRGLFREVSIAILNSITIFNVTIFVDSSQLV
jgi:hypothetical protein